MSQITILSYNTTYLYLHTLTYINILPPETLKLNLKSPFRHESNKKKKKIKKYI